MKKTDGNQMFIGDHTALTITSAISINTSIGFTVEEKVGNYGAATYITLKKGDSIFPHEQRVLYALWNKTELFGIW